MERYMLFSYRLRTGYVSRHTDTCHMSVRMCKKMKSDNVHIYSRKLLVTRKIVFLFRVINRKDIFVAHFVFFFAGKESNCNL
jgi:hypothetical protein